MQPGTETSTVRNATWTLSNFCRGKPQPPFNVVRNALPTLAGLISKEGSQDEEVLTDACWALSYLSDGPNDKIQAVIESGVCMRLVKLLMHPSFQQYKHQLYVRLVILLLGTIYRLKLLSIAKPYHAFYHFYQALRKVLEKKHVGQYQILQLETMIQIQAVIDAGIVPPLINLLNSAEFDIKKEAAWAISNATSGGTSEQINFLVSQGCILPLCELLEVNDAKIVTVALEGLENILKIGEDLKIKMAVKIHMQF